MTVSNVEYIESGMEHDDLAPPEPPTPLVKRPAPSVGILAEPPGAARERKNAAARIAATGPEFIGECYKHGDTLFETDSGACLSCLAVMLPALPILAAYRAAGASRFRTACPEHGDTLHSARTGRCFECYKPGGQRVETPRTLARKAGASSYLAVCPTHGEHPHHTIRGKCLGCYNSLGYPRKKMFTPAP